MPRLFPFWRSLPSHTLGLLLIAACSAQISGSLAPCFASKPTFLLQSRLSAGDRAIIEADLDVGGHLVVPQNQQGDETGQKTTSPTRLPMSVVAGVRYQQHVVSWSPESDEPGRSLRYYEKAQATIKVAEGGTERSLAEDARLVVTEIRDQRPALAGLYVPLTREEHDLINIAGNPIALDRLLPGKLLAEGDQWKHDASVIGALLGLEHTAVSEVTSVVIGEKNHQVQVRIAGTVHGTIDGAATEMSLQGAYLFHLQHGRITKFNLAIEELRSPGAVAPGLDIVAKLKLTIAPCQSLAHIRPKALQLAQKQTEPIRRELIYRSPDRGFEFNHNTDWYVTANGRDLLALGQLREGELVAHCNITILPPRAKGRETELNQFERDIRQSLGKHFKEVAAANQWTTPAGHQCLGIIVNGEIQGVPLQWRYYLIASPDLPRVSLAFTLEQPKEGLFADSDRSIVDSMKLYQDSTVRVSSIRVVAEGAK
jgi:hypothetical protein